MEILGDSLLNVGVFLEPSRDYIDCISYKLFLQETIKIAIENRFGEYVLSRNMKHN